MKNDCIMTKLSLLIITCFLFIGTAFSQTEQDSCTERLNKVKNDTLKAFLKKFETFNYPIKLTELNESNVINKKLVKHFLDIELEVGFGYEEFYYNIAFYEENYIGLVFTRYFSPGAFGINNYFVNLITIDYSGNVIDDEDIGCFCNDTNMGSNDYYASDIKVTIEKGNIFVIEDNTHATLIVEDEEDAFENITTEEYTITINSDGKISREY